MSDFIIKDGCLNGYTGSGGEVVIPAGVTKIANSAFNPHLDGIAAKHYAGRKAITSVVIPEGVVAIGSIAFANCEKLKKITAASSVRCIGSAAFHNTPWLKKQPDCVTLNSVFVEYRGAEAAVTIPAGITAIADEAFDGCKTLGRVDIPDTVTAIGERAFFGCENLECMELPPSVTQIGRDAFLHTKWLAGHGEDFVIFNGILYAYQGSSPKVVVPDTVTAITDGAFSRCDTLKSVTIPDGVTAIAPNTFSLCSNLKQVAFSPNVKSIGAKAFYLCNKLQTLPDMSGIEVMGDYAFHGCSKLYDKQGRLIVGHTLFDWRGGKTLELPESVTSIDPWALEDAEELETVTACPAAFEGVWSHLKPANKAQVAWNCLKNDTLHNAAKAYIKRNKEKIWAQILLLDDAAVLDRFFAIVKQPDLGTLEQYIESAAGRVNLTAYLLNHKAARFTPQQSARRQEEQAEKALGIRELTLADWKEIFKLSVRDGCVCISGYKKQEALAEIPAVMDGRPVTTLADGAFKGSAFLREVILPDSITVIGANAFKNCTALERVRLPQALTEIGYSAFEGCAALTDCGLTQPNQTITFIGGNVFKGCTALTQIILPEKLDRVCAGLFDGCAALETVSIPASVTAIYDYAFRDCKQLAAVQLPESLTLVGQGAFTNCKGLTQLILPEQVNEIDYYAFRNCTRLTRIVIPDATKIIRPNAFNGCKKLTICANAGSRGLNFAKANKIPVTAE